MDKKSKNAIIISIVALAIVLITVTYAYFSARITGIESASTISLTAGTMGIVYNEGNEEVTFNNIYPKNDPWVTKTFTLTANNTTTLTMYYDLGLNVITNNFPDDYLTYDLTLVSSTNGTPIATKTNQSINGTGKIKFGKGSFTDATNDTHNYELKIYFKDNGENQNDAQGAVFNAKIYVEEAFEDAPEGWYNPTVGSLLAGIKSNNNSLSTIGTVPGREPSASRPITQSVSDFCEGESDCDVSYYPTREDAWNLDNESSGNYSTEYSNLVGNWIHTIDSEYYVTSATASSITYTNNSRVLTEEKNLLLSTEDDYGTSYYYRGAVENNYVVFANMCWRIVRVDGLGNTKLVLYNYNPNNVANPCATSEDGETNAFARYNIEYESEFNTNINKNTYIGYMYSNNPDSSDFDTAHANDNDSTILTFLKNWYDQNLRNYNDMLADVIWCNDKSIVTDTTYNPSHNPYGYGSIQGTGLSEDITYYKATYRLKPVNTAAPSLVCPSVGSDGKLSKFTARDAINGNAKLYSDNKEYKIGLLTADEIAFAGAIAGANNNAYYLYKNANGNWYWLLSPDGFDGNVAEVWIGGEYGNLNCIGLSNAAGVRPAVSLKSTVTMVSGGTGTSSNPFVVSS